MKNPWIMLPEVKPFVLPDELNVIQAFNNRCSNKEHRLQTHIFPEPYIGNVNSPVYLLSLNPGFSQDDIIWHKKENFSNSIRKNLSHELTDYPFYFLNPKFHDSPGSNWWLQKLKSLINDSSIESVSNNIFCVELFGYHSYKYKELPKAIISSPLPSEKYATFLVKRAIERKVKIVVMRSYKKWLQKVPALRDYENCYVLNNPQNVVVSPNNLNYYDDIASEF